MSNIPSSAVGNALSPVTRQNNEAMRARKIQQQKNFHHTEEVEELNDTAIEATKDRDARNGNQDLPENKEKDGEEKVDIAALNDTPPTDTAANKSSKVGPPRLDISA